MRGRNLPMAPRRINRAGGMGLWYGIANEALGTVKKGAAMHATKPDGQNVVWNDAELDAFVESDAFDTFLLECFEQGIREAVAEQQALGLPDALSQELKDALAA